MEALDLLFLSLQSCDVVFAVDWFLLHSSLLIAVSGHAWVQIESRQRARLNWKIGHEERKKASKMRVSPAVAIPLSSWSLLI